LWRDLIQCWHDFLGKEPQTLLGHIFSALFLGALRFSALPNHFSYIRTKSPSVLIEQDV
jgi:hypothetical protein